MHWKDSFPDDRFFAGLRRALPPIFTRETASAMTGGLFSARTLSNLDAKGRGPGRKLRIGKKVAYNKEDFLAFLHRLACGTGGKT